MSQFDSSAFHAALGRRLTLKGYYSEPVLIESVAEKGALLFLRVRTANGHTLCYTAFYLRNFDPLNDHGYGSVRCIEVKGNAQSSEPIVLTPNERLQVDHHGDSWLYVVWGCKTTAPELITIQNLVVTLDVSAKPLVEVRGG